MNENNPYLLQPTDVIPSLGDLYRPPAEFKQGEWADVATMMATSKDRMNVIIQECRMPERFFRVVIFREDITLKDERLQALQIASGEGVEGVEILVFLAHAVANGVIGFYKAEMIRVDLSRCHPCLGTGVIDGYSCIACGGTGTTQYMKTLN